jgi:fido (protein-threonine AMPylation protein)
MSAARGDGPQGLGLPGIRRTEAVGLIPTHIALRSELNELEQANIADADRWAFSRKRNALSEPFLGGLHRRMFNRLWKRAGDYRTTERNLGVAAYRIQPDLMQAIGDARYWMENTTGLTKWRCVFTIESSWCIPFRMAMAAGRGLQPTC